MLNIVLILRSTIEIELQLSWQLKPQLLMQHLKLFLIRYFLQCMQDKQAFISKIYIKNFRGNGTANIALDCKHS